jgi:sterol 24-C-methyltransferase
VKTPRLSDLGRGTLPSSRVQGVVDAYATSHAGAVAARTAHYAEVVNQYYDLVTDFYEYGWGQSFHFAPRLRGESLAASLARHQFHLALALALAPGMRVLDLGCGVGGPMRAIARFSGARIVGVNNNAYQVDRARAYNARAGLAAQCEVVHGDVMALPFPDASFDGVYGLQAMCHLPDWRALFTGVRRVMKPGARLAASDWVLTERYDDGAEHRAIRKGIEVGGGLPDLHTASEALAAIEAAGLTILEHRDLAGESDPETPWYQPLAAGWSMSGLMHTRLGRWLTNRMVRVLETARIAPRGATAVSTFLNAGADAMVAGGRTGIFTPLLYLVAVRS